jgi:hypothetical protein
MDGNRHTHRRLNSLGIALVASLALLLTGVAAHAQTILATGAIYGGLNTHTEACYLFNAGLSPVTIKSGTIYGENGPNFGFPTSPPYPPNAVPITALHFNSCGPSPATLLPGKTCGIASEDDTNQAWSCAFWIINSSTSNVRGVMDLRDINDNELINSNLR